MSFSSLTKRLSSRAIKAATNGLFFAPSHWAKRRADHWVFGSTFDNFDCNSKYLFLWVLEHHPEIEATWITGKRETYETLREAGYPVEMRWSPAGIKKTLTAGVAIFRQYPDDVNMPLLGGAKLVNLWHGVGLKRIEYECKPEHQRLYLKRRNNPLVRLAFLERFRDIDLFISTSPEMTTHFARCFRMSERQIFEAGYPRLDGAVDQGLATRAREGAGVEEALAEAAAGRRVIVYMPTWRNSGRSFFEAAFPDLDRLEAALERANAVLFLKPHRLSYDEPLRLFAGRRHIHVLPLGSDPYVLFQGMDCLVTDYSSVLYDYIYVRDAGCVVYSFDEREYLEKDQGLIAPFEDNIIGERARSFAEFCSLLESGRAFGALDPERLRSLREKFWATSASPASPRIVERVKAMLEEQP